MRLANVPLESLMELHAWNIAEDLFVSVADGGAESADVKSLSSELLTSMLVGGGEVGACLDDIADAGRAKVAQDIMTDWAESGLVASRAAASKGRWFLTDRGRAHVEAGLSLRNPSRVVVPRMEALPEDMTLYELAVGSERLGFTCSAVSSKKHMRALQRGPYVLGSAGVVVQAPR